MKVVLAINMRTLHSLGTDPTANGSGYLTYVLMVKREIHYMKAQAELDRESRGRVGVSQVPWLPRCGDALASLAPSHRARTCTNVSSQRNPLPGCRGKLHYGRIYESALTGQQGERNLRSTGATQPMVRSLCEATSIVRKGDE